MEELKRILLEHGARYPAMEPTDAVKLLYQNELGGGHLIRDEESCLNYLRQEYDAVRKKPGSPKYEDIGNGILRVHLGALEEQEVEALGRAFLRSATEHRGNLDAFLDKLALLEELTTRGVFSFGPRELEAYLAQYRAAGFPAVSHSPTYREAYTPAYRIILKKYMF